jgi:hypothetical protein
MSDSKYDFDPARCKRAIEKMADLVYDSGDPEADSALDDLIMDIEDLHRAAQARDNVLDALENMPCISSNSGELVPLDAIDEVIGDYRNYEFHEIADLNL